MLLVEFRRAHTRPVKCTAATDGPRRYTQVQKVIKQNVLVPRCSLLTDLDVIIPGQRCPVSYGSRWNRSPRCYYISRGPRTVCTVNEALTYWITMRSRTMVYREGREILLRLVVDFDSTAFHFPGLSSKLLGSRWLL